jgi:hypothetical protein
MGGAIVSYHDRTGFPEMCYNAANFWQLGWFADRSISVDDDIPTLVRVAAFVDYDKTTAGQHYVLVETGNVYIFYNRAKDFNIDTHEYKDSLIAYQDDGKGTFLMTALDSNKMIYERSFNKGVWHLEICDIVSDGGYGPDYVAISIGFGNSLCDSFGNSNAIQELFDTDTRNYHTSERANNHIGKYEDGSRKRGDVRV